MWRVITWILHLIAWISHVITWILHLIGINFTCDHMNFTSDRMNFTCDHMNFTSDGINFTCVRMNFTSYRMNFTFVHMNFTSDRMNFTCDQINFICYFVIFTRRVKLYIKIYYNSIRNYAYRSSYYMFDGSVLWPLDVPQDETCYDNAAPTIHTMPQILFRLHKVDILLLCHWIELLCRPNNSRMSSLYSRCFLVVLELYWVGLEK